MATKSKNGRAKRGRAIAAESESSSRRLATIAESRFRGLLARYDAATTNDENRRHWSAADTLSPQSANSRGVRSTLVSRSRYEVANNCYANGMVRTLAIHLVGRGPRVQIGGMPREISQRIERRIASWAKEIELASKLLTMRQAKARDGEAFGLLVNNRKLRGQVQLDLRLIETDCVASPPGTIESESESDGVRFDADGNPTAYHVLKTHPGDSFHLGDFAGDWKDASAVVHWFRTDRAGQRRGVPEITPALPLFALLRRYTLATLSAAEIAALFALFLKTNTTLDPMTVDEFTVLNVERNALTTLPEGWDVTQMDAKQPTTTFDGFTTAILREIARALDIPYSVAAGDSSKLNYSSGRLDHQTYARAVDVERGSCESVVLDRLVREWANEAALIPGILDGAPPFDEWSIEWYWMPFEHVDPLKEASAAAIRVANCLSSIPSELGDAGVDWIREQERAAESLGLSLAEYRKRLADKLLGPLYSAQVAQGVAATSSAAAIESSAARIEQAVEALVDQVDGLGSRSL